MDAVRGVDGRPGEREWAVAERAQARVVLGARDAAETSGATAIRIVAADLDGASVAVLHDVGRAERLTADGAPSALAPDGIRDHGRRQALA